MKPESPWLAKLKALAVMGEEDPASAAEEMTTLTGGKFTRAPRGWFSWDLGKRARYLDEKFPLDKEFPLPMKKRVQVSLDDDVVELLRLAMRRDVDLNSALRQGLYAEQVDDEELKRQVQLRIKELKEYGKRLP